MQREKAGHATELASDTVAGLRVLRGIGGEELFLGRYRRASQEVREAAVRSARMWALISAIQVLLPGVLLIALVWYGATLARDGRIEVGQLVTVYSAATLMLFPLRHFEEIAMAYSFSRPSAQRAVRVLSLSRGARTATAEALVPEGDLYDPVTGLLAPRGLFTAVVCGDPDEAGRLADRLGGHAEPDGRAPDEAGADTATAEAGGSDTKNTQGTDTNGPEKTGPDPSEGDASKRDGTGTDGAPGPGEDRRLPSVLLGGVALDELPLGSARTAVLVQDKDPVLLSGTLRELLDVPSSGTVTAEDALAAAQCADVLDALAQASVDADGDPMDTRITERGRSLSGGQRQRLALARSLVTDPEALVLDEPTSAVDSHTEARVAAGVKRLRAGRTTVAFSSSPLLLDLADRVALVHGGRVVAAGTHRALLRDEARYRAVVTRETDDTAAPAATDRENRLASIDVSRAAGATEEIEERA